jgi:hypothetical protein
MDVHGTWKFTGMGWYTGASTEIWFPKRRTGDRVQIMGSPIFSLYMFWETPISRKYMDKHI